MECPPLGRLRAAALRPARQGRRPRPRHHQEGRAGDQGRAQAPDRGGILLRRRRPAVPEPAMRLLEHRRRQRAHLRPGGREAAADRGDRAGGLGLIRRPPLAVGIAVAAAGVALTTLLLYALDDIAPVLSLGVVYLFAVLLVATVWGALLGIATAIASAAAFNFFHIPPTGRFTIAESENWVGLVVFFVAAVGASWLA